MRLDQGPDEWSSICQDGVRRSFRAGAGAIWRRSARDGTVLWRPGCSVSRVGERRNRLWATLAEGTWRFVIADLRNMNGMMRLDELLGFAVRRPLVRRQFAHAGHTARR